MNIKSNLLRKKKKNDQREINNSSETHPYPGKKMDIRKYKHGEESEIWDVVFSATRESNARDYHPELIDRWAPHDKDMGEWVERLNQKIPFVAVVDDKIVGLAEIEKKGFIDYFYVHPKMQGVGIGKALLKTLESEALSYGVDRIYADVSVTAKDFFESQGFRVKEARENIIIGHPAPNFAMEKLLKS